MVPPLALDIDGTLTTPSGRLDSRVFELLPAWEAPVVFATGKAFPYPIALATFLGRPLRVVAENGGVVHVDGDTMLCADPASSRAAAEAFLERVRVGRAVVRRRERSCVGRCRRRCRSRRRVHGRNCGCA